MLSARTVDRCTGELRRDIAMFDLSTDDELAMAEVALRTELEIMTGQRDDVARIMPEHHIGRRTAPSATPT